MTKEDNKIREKIIKGLELSQKKLVQSKKDRNLELIVSHKGKVTKINAINL